MPLANHEAFNKSLVVPEPILTSRLRSGGGVRRTDIPVSSKLYDTMRDIGDQVAGVDIVLPGSSSNPVHVMHGSGQKMYPLHMSVSLNYREGHQPRRAHVVELLTNMLFRAIAGDTTSFYQKDGDAKTFCASLNSFAKNNISLRPYGEDDPFLTWIEKDVAERLRARSIEFSGLKVTKYTSDALEITFI